MAAILAHLNSGLILVHLAGLSQVCGFLIRDQLVMRLFLFVGSTLYVCYFFFPQQDPLWTQIVWTTILAVANLSVILRLLIERTTFRMRPEEIALYGAFRTMSPGEFRRLLRKCRWEVTEGETTLIEAGKPNSHLFYITSADARVHRPEGDLTLRAGSFAGEISFLLGTPATATVSVPANTRYVYWKHEDLTTIERSNPSMRIALRELLNVDLAQKVLGHATR